MACFLRLMPVGTLCSWLPLAMVSLRCPLEWVQGYVGNTPLSLSVRRFPEKPVCNEKTHSECLFACLFFYLFFHFFNVTGVGELPVCMPTYHVHAPCPRTQKTVLSVGPTLNKRRRQAEPQRPSLFPGCGHTETSRLLFPRPQLQLLCFLCHFFPATVGETLQLRANRNLECSSITYFDTATRK